MTILIQILILEDSEDDILLLAKELKRSLFDFQYKQVDTLDAFHDELLRTSWDIIISDYNLMGFSALDALDVYRKTNLDIPFIIVSGVMGEESAVEAMRSGAHDYLIKSNLSRLAPAIERELKKAEIRKENKRMEQKIKNYQNQLRVFASELSLTEERERRRIATELHDRIGQTLAMSRIKLKSLKNASFPNVENELLESVIFLIEQTIQDTRTLTFEISPTILYELGFEAAVEWLLEKLPAEYGIKASLLDDNHPKPLGDDVRILLFRAVRELLFNVIKHAHAKNISISISRGVQQIVVEVMDDGVGFDPDSLHSPGRTAGFGLFSITERLGYLGGNISIHSDQAGTHVTLVAPLKD